MNWLKKVVQNRNLPIVIILTIGLIIGFFIFRDFGVGLDEPEYYQYADSTIQAYSIKALLTNQYSLESSFGPGDLRYYGPSFLILGKGVLPVLSFFLPKTQVIDLWHFTIYIFFLLGVFFFYKLALRWTSLKPAIVSTILFISQPVLFGNAWIDPKDIPLLVFFLGTIYFGLLFSDRFMLFLSTWKKIEIQKKRIKNPWFSFKGKWHKTYLIFGAILFFFSLSLTIWSDQIKKYVSELILSINVDSPVTFFEKFFVAHIRAISKVPLSYYSHKSTLIFDRMLPLLGIITLLLCALLIFIHRYPRSVANCWEALKQNIVHFRSYFRVQPHRSKLILYFLVACLFLASASATRVIGPLSGVLVIIIWIINFRKQSFPLIVFYGLCTFVLFFIQWPYIWQNTIQRLLFVFQHMSNNPVGVNVLFAGTTFDSRHLPAMYFPGLLGVTLTEPVILLGSIGIGILVYQLFSRKFRNLEWLIPLGWFFIPLAYIIISRPPMYDNYRHFIFVLPALFIFASMALQKIFKKIRSTWLQLIISIVILVPGIVSLIQLHPFEYSYYNAIAGGVKGAENNYELDYWLTCYKQLGEMVQQNETKQVNVYSDLSTEILSSYQYSNIIVNSIRSEPFIHGSLLFLPIRWGHSTLYNQYPIVYSVSFQNVDLCVARRVQ
jgi:hypothetical protein